MPRARGTLRMPVHDRLASAGRASESARSAASSAGARRWAVSTEPLRSSMSAGARAGMGDLRPSPALRHGAAPRRARSALSLALRFPPLAMAVTVVALVIAVFPRLAMAMLALIPLAL